jgi:hypothetical protein
LGFDKLLVGGIGHKEGVFLLSEPVLPGLVSIEKKVLRESKRSHPHRSASLLPAQELDKELDDKEVRDPKAAPS